MQAVTTKLMYTTTSIGTEFNYCFLEAASSNNISGDVPLFDIESSAEIGLVAGAKVKIFGCGGEVKAGVSKELVKASLSNGVQYGGNWKVDGALGAFIFGANASKSLSSEDASLGGNIFLYEVNMDLIETTQSITILDLNTYFIIGGSLKIKMNLPRVIMPSGPDPLPDYPRDNTNIIVLPPLN